MPPGGATPIQAGASDPSEVVEFALPPSGDLDLDHEHDDAPLRFRKMEDLLGPDTPHGPAERGVVEDLLLAVGEEPATHEEALKEVLAQGHDAGAGLQ